MTAIAAEPPFEFVLYPNQPLPTAGFLLLMAAVLAVSVALGGAFLVAGAWPVTGFLGLDVVGLFVAFRLVRRRARAVETVRVDRDAVTLRSVAPAGAAVEVRLEPYWARVRLEERGRRGRLMVGSHGRGTEIGRFLTLDEKRELAAAIETALARLARPAPA